MLKLSLTSGEYLTIGNDIVVQVYHTEGRRTYLAISAPREVPIIRGTVLEQAGNPRPEGLVDLPLKGHRAKPLFQVSPD